MNMSTTSDYDYFQNKRADRVYLSKSMDQKYSVELENGQIQELKRPFRVISKIIEPQESHVFIKDGKEISLRITSGEKQEIKAKFYEDTRGIFTLTIQKYTIESGFPHNTYFTFQGNEIGVLFNFLRNISFIPLTGSDGMKIDDKILNEIVLSKEQAIELINKYPDLISELIKNDITKEEIINFGYRKKQLDTFKNLLEDEDFFNDYKDNLCSKKGTEAVWQDFFECNTWIFGYGLTYVFNSPLDNKKLEQYVKGFDFNSSGKRIDALMKSRGIVSSLCFGEIKTHKTHLLKQTKDPYREECWSISSELSGAIAQIQKTVQKSIENIATKIEPKDNIGNLTGEQLFIYQPKSFIVIGSLGEFKNGSLINEEKYSSFELYRQNQINPEIITFDELYERAKYIVMTDEDNNHYA
jgi:hypothetical protein